jgi:hypothetical protein
MLLDKRARARVSTAAGASISPCRLLYSLVGGQPTLRLPGLVGPSAEISVSSLKRSISLASTTLVVWSRADPA